MYFLKNYTTTLLVVFISLFFSGVIVHADVVTTIKEKISSTSLEIQKIEAEIAEYEKELQVIGGEKKTLQNEISRLNLSAKKLSADISLTESKIYNATLSIDQIEEQIAEKELKINTNKNALTASIRSIQINDGVSTIEAMLSHQSLTDFWSKVDTLETFQISLQEHTEELQKLREALRVNREEELHKKAELAHLRASLQGQKQVIDYNKREKDTILAVTKNEESKYQEYLEDAKQKREEFERELSQLESDLKIAIDPSVLPTSGKGVLSWPLSKIVITQKFGNTAFAQGGAYNGKGHNGVDFGIPTGTPVKTAGSGVVEAFGNTDEIRGCYSYGKWILVKHPTGLSTLYAHLSVISVERGESVAVGDVIGYSGNTGYSTGPHLHFSVYATQGVRVVRLGDIKKITNCGNAYIPVAPFEAYLNPLDYL